MTKEQNWTVATVAVTIEHIIVTYPAFLDFTIAYFIAMRKDADVGKKQKKSISCLCLFCVATKHITLPTCPTVYPDHRRLFDAYIKSSSLFK